MGRLRGSIAALIAGALLVLPIAPAQADEEADAVGTEAARETASVSIPVRMVPGPPPYRGANGLVEIRLGNSPAIPVAIDTGFSGLVLFPGALAGTVAGVRRTGDAISVVRSDGSKIPGAKAQATLTLNGIQSVVPVPFIVSNSDSPVFASWRRAGARGLLGVGTKGNNAMVNPLSTLPGNLGLRYSIHFERNATDRGGRNGALVLGAEAPTDPTMVFQLQSTGTDLYGANVWNDHAAPGCWTFGTGRAQCVPTTFDAAFNIMRAKGPIARRIQTQGPGLARPGTRVSLSSPTSAFTGWTFAAGRTGSANVVKVLKGRSAVNTGNAVFFDFTVTYNLVTGRIYLSDPMRKAG